MQSATLFAYVGIDIGTGSTKAVALNHSVEVIASAQFYYPTISPQAGFSEQDPDMIWDAFVKCINKITGTVTQTPMLITLSSCMHSLIVMDRDNNAITGMITWADTRSEN